MEHLIFNYSSATLKKSKFLTWHWHEMDCVFVFLAKVGACGGNYTAESTVIYSPDFPDKYAPGRVCYWTIQVKNMNFMFSNKILFKRFEPFFIMNLKKRSLQITILSSLCFSRSQVHRSSSLTSLSSTLWTRQIWSSCWMATPIR